MSEPDRTTETAMQIDVGGPWFEDLSVGDRIEEAPALTVTEGLAAVHQAILGCRFRLGLDATLAEHVLCTSAPPINPALVCDISIGQSTLITQRVIANLFYRGLAFRRLPSIGDTLRTTTEVVGLRQNSPKPGRAATGMAVLHIRTVDQDERPVLDYWRCAMLPLRDPEGVTGHDFDLARIPAEIDRAALRETVAGWRLDRFRAEVPGPHFADLEPGSRWRIEGGDPVTAAPELARLSLNVAMAHHDEAANGGRRLVYGGHTIGLAAAQATRALPNLVTILAWHECSHTAPVHEGDTLRSELELERLEPLPEGGGLVDLRSTVSAEPAGGGDRRQVLDWRFIGVMA